MRPTGDVVQIKEDGCLVYVERVDHQVKVLGKRVDLRVVSKVIETIPDIHQCK